MSVTESSEEIKQVKVVGVGEGDFRQGWSGKEVLAPESCEESVREAFHAQESHVQRS